MTRAHAPLFPFPRARAAAVFWLTVTSLDVAVRHLSSEEVEGIGVPGVADRK